MEGGGMPVSFRPDGAAKVRRARAEPDLCTRVQVVAYRSMKRSIIVACAFGAMASAFAQTNEELNLRAEEPYQGGWRLEDQLRDAEMWRALSEKSPGDQQARYNWFVSSRNASLARNQGEVPEADRKQLATIASELKKEAPNSFEAHMAGFHLEFPARSAFVHLNAAASVAPDRAELLGPHMAKALLDGDDAALQRACKEIQERGGISSALLDVASDLLLSVDPNGIVITNGEMDTYPALVKQRNFGVRKDVLVIDQRLLADAAYRAHCWARAKAVGSVPTDGVAFVRGLLDATTRPVFLALSLDPTWAKALENELYVTGIALRYSHQRVDNIPQLEQRWKSMTRNMYAGPLTANYLLPGAVLLRHYRSVGDETKAAQMEHTVRGIAEAQHLTTRLYQLGIIAH